MADQANGAQLSSMIRDEDLKELEDFQKDLEDRTHKAREDGRHYMLAKYTTMLAGVTAEVHKIRARFNRENIAFLRKEQKRLKEESRGESSDEE